MQGTSLNGQVAILSGALGDIGRAIAMRLARMGADITLADVAEASGAERLLCALRGLGRRARYDRVDVADAAAVQGWLAGTEAQLGTGTLVVTSAATVTMAGIREVTPEQWQRELAVNLNGSFHVAQAAANRMIAAGRKGRIVFVGSWAAEVPHAHIPAYSVSKAGVRMLCKCMALELAPAGIAVNEIAPGYVDAGLSAAVFRANPGAREECRRQLPTGELITADEVAHEVGYLCADASPHMTGTTLLLDGGLSLRPTRSPKAEGSG